MRTKQEQAIMQDVRVVAHAPRTHELTRRQLLGAGAGLSAAMLSGSGLPAGVMGRAVRAQDGAAEFHGAQPYQAPPNGHYNYFVTDNILPPSGIYGDMMHLPFGLYMWASQEWIPLLAESWSYLQTGHAAAATPGASPAASPAAGSTAEADTFQLTLRQGLVWSDGNPITSADVISTYNIFRMQQSIAWNYLASVEAVDDLTVNFNMSVPSSVLERYILRSAPFSSAIYGEWGQRATDYFAGGGTVEDPEILQITEELNQFRPEQIIASGPFIIDLASVTNAQLTMVKNDFGYLADQVAFDRIIDYNGETDTISAVVLSNEIDYATHGFAPATEQQMIAQGIRIVRPPIYSGPALFINYATLGDAFGDKRVRQAIAHALDRSQNGIVSLADSGVGVQYMTGMSDNLLPNWVEPSAMEQFNQYEFNRDRATELLTEVGWTQDGEGRWLLPDGTPTSFELIFPAEFADWSASGQDFANQLTDFGIEIVPRAVTFTQQAEDVLNGRFQLAIRGWGSSSNPHPHFSYTADLFTNNKVGTQDATVGMSYPLVQETEVVGQVDLQQLTLDAAAGLDQTQQVETLTTLALAFNELLPIVPFFERYGNNPALEGVRVASWPADDDPIYQNSPYADGIPDILMLTGVLQPVQS